MYHHVEFQQNPSHKLRVPTNNALIEDIQTKGKTARN